MAEEEEVSVVVDGFISWPEIVGLHVVRKNLQKEKEKAKEIGFDYTPKGQLTYKGKIKLHGCNGGINISEKEGEYYVEAQSRSRVLSAESDLDGFSKWTSSHTKDFIHVRNALKEAFPNTTKTVIFGEWCGEGIQKNVALCKIGKKIFAVFSLMVDECIIAEPDIIRTFFPKELPQNLYIIPWMTSAECGETIGIDFNQVDELEAEVVKINKLIGRIDNSDPWVLETFKVDGPGEGVVWYPVSLQTGTIPYLARRDFSKLAFKAKGEKHAVAKQAKPVQIKPQVSSGVLEFVDMFVTDGRGEQGLGKISENGDKPSKVHTAQFIQWMVADVKKESATELEASGFTWQQVEKEVGTAARKWFFAHVN